MRLFEICTTENGKEADFGIHGVYSEEDNPDAKASGSFKLITRKMPLNTQKQK